MGGKRLQRIRRFCIVVGQQQVSYAVVEGIVQTSLALESVALTEGAVLEQQAYDLVVATQTGLRGPSAPCICAAAAAVVSGVGIWLTKIKGV